MSELAFLTVSGLAAVAAAFTRSALFAGVLAGLAAVLALPVAAELRSMLAPGLLALIPLWLAVRARRGAAGEGSTAAVAWAGLASAFIALSGIAVWLLPLPRLVEPTGAYAVGVRNWVIVDTARVEPLTDDPTDHRVLAVRAWYPAAPEEADALPRAPYLPDVGPVYRGIALSLGVPKVVVSGAARIRTNGRLDAPPAPGGPWPLLLYSGGYRQGHQAHNTELAEELASRGYVVVGTNHPYEEAITYGQDGSLLTLEDPLVQDRIRDLMEEQGPAPMPTADELMALDTATRRHRVETYLAGLPFHQRSARLWVEDMRSVLAAVEAGRGGFGAALQPLVDLDALGIFGMSFGGSTAGLFCATEARCQAGVNLDGTQWGTWFGNDFTRPFLYMSQVEDAWNDAWYDGAGPGYTHVAVTTALHGDFTDGFQSTPLSRWTGVLGPIGGRRSTEILRAYVVPFFERHLKGADVQVPEDPSAFPEVERVR